MNDAGKGTRILFVELWRLGDAVSATAALRALRLARPAAVIGVVAHPFHGDPLLRSPDADVQIAFDAFWTRGKLPRHKYLPWTIDYGALARAAKQIRSFQADHVLMFRGDVREQLFFSLVTRATLTDLEGKYSWHPFVSKYQRPTHAPRWKQHLSLVTDWTGTRMDTLPRLAHVATRASRDEYILIHPGASWRFKQWGARNFAVLIEWLLSEGRAVRVVAGPDDRAFIQSLKSHLDVAVPVEFPTLDELYTVVQQARLVICNNSAALHIAEALGTPCLALTGPSDPVVWGTYRPHSRTLIKSLDLPCHPCGEKRCVRPSAPCIDDITLRDVILALGTMEAFCGEPEIQLSTSDEKTTAAIAGCANIDRRSRKVLPE